MIRTQVSLDDDEYRSAKREAKRQGISLAELVRRGLSLVLASARRDAPSPDAGTDKPWMRHAGCLRSGDPDSSGSVDAIVYGREQP